jgi:hypothetical protein
MVSLIAAVLAVLTVGFFVGLLTFRLKQRWCPTCGATLTCPDPASHMACHEIFM